MKHSYDIAVDPGLEDIGAAEIVRRFEAAALSAETEEKPFDLPGHIEVKTAAEGEAAVSVLKRLHSAYYIVELRETVSLGAGETKEEAILPVLDRLREMPFPELESTETFCVRCRRVGNHPFQSPDVEREAGAVLWKRFSTPVNLEEPACTVRVDVTGSTARIGILRGSDSLSRRFNWAWRPRVTLRTTLAHGMLELGGFRELPAEATLLDPFCGSGTVPIEAASLRRDMRYLASDWDPEAVQGARANLAATGYTEAITVKEANALDLATFWGSDSAAVIVTNPPFGVRLAKETNMLGFYHSFLREAREVVIPGGRLVVMVGKKRRLFNQAVEQLGSWEILHARIVEFGGIFPGIFVLG